MISQKKMVKTIFDEFSTFLENTEVLRQEFGEDIQKEFKIIHDLFKRKIQRCEVVKPIILPSENNEIDVLFKLISDKIQECLAKNNSYLRLKKSILKEVLADFESNDKAILPTEMVLSSIYDNLSSDNFNHKSGKNFSFNVSSQIISTIFNQYNYYYPEEIIESLYITLYDLLTELMLDGLNSKGYFIHEALERLAQKELIFRMQFWDILTNISYNCLNFLIDKSFIKFKRGLIEASEKNLKKGIRKFNREIYSFYNFYPAILKNNLLIFTYYITEELLKVIKKDSIGREYTIEGAISLAVESVYNNFKSYLSHQKLTEFILLCILFRRFSNRNNFSNFNELIKILALQTEKPNEDDSIEFKEIIDGFHNKIEVDLNNCSIEALQDLEIKDLNKGIPSRDLLKISDTNETISIPKSEELLNNNDKSNLEEKKLLKKSYEMNNFKKDSALSGNESYSTLEFINDLLIEMPNIYDQFQNLSKTNLMEKLSVTIFNKGNHFLKHILSRIRNKNHPDYNPFYKFSIETLDEAEKNLKKLLKNKATGILEYFKNYRVKNPELKEYFHEQWRIHNPNLKSRFFKQLNNVNKRYWYGFIGADGSITSGNDPSTIRYQIAIEISEKDRNHLVKFCDILGLKTDKIGERIKIINGKQYQLVYIIFTCKPMYQDLVNLGLKDLKEGSKFSMTLGDDNLSYSLLLGFYDGEGGEGTTRIYSTNYDLLSQIKKSYALKAEIRERDIEEIPDCVIKESISRTKPIFDLALGAELLNKMMNSYPDSLVRKRKSFSEQRNAMESLKEKIKDKKNLKNLIEKYGKVKLAENMNVSYRTLDNLCDEWNVEARKFSAPERLKNKVEDRENLIEIIETYGKDKATKELKTGYKTLEALMEEWGIDASYLTVKEKLKRKIGDKDNLQKLVKNDSLSKLAEKFGVGRNTLRRLCDEWGIEI